MKRVKANYGRPHAKRPVDVGSGAETKSKRSCSPRAEPVDSSSSTNPLVQHAHAGGHAFGRYVDNFVDAHGTTEGKGGSATRQLKEQLKEQLEAEERRVTGANLTPAGSAHDDTAAKFCDCEMQTDVSVCPPTPAPVLASAAVQVGTRPTVAVETQTDVSPVPGLGDHQPAINCATQTESLLVEIGCQCGGVEQASADEGGKIEPVDTARETTEAGSPTPGAKRDGSTQQADPQQAEVIAQQTGKLSSEGAVGAMNAAMVEASRTAANLEKAHGQIVNLEFANDLLMQQVGEVKNQLKSMSSKELAARQALAKLQQDHEKEVARWQKLMDSTVQNVQGQMSQLLEGTTQKISVLQQQAQHKDAQIAQLREQCTDLEASVYAHKQAADAAAETASSAHEQEDDVEMDADAIFAAVDGVEEEEYDDDVEEDEDEARHTDDETMPSPEHEAR